MVLHSWCKEEREVNRKGKRKECMGVRSVDFREKTWQMVDSVDMATLQV